MKFLKVIDQVTPAGKEIHLIADNYATHKHPKVQKWLARRARFHVYFTPTSSSWLNMLERFFRDLTQNRLRRGVFRETDSWITGGRRNKPEYSTTAPSKHLRELLKRHEMKAENWRQKICANI